MSASRKLGAIGDVVKVKDGFARNYLLPNKKALRANESNRKLFEANRARIEEENADRAVRRRESIEGRRRQIRQADPSGVEHRPALRLGLARATSPRRSRASAPHVAKSQVVLDRPIKAIGLHEVKIALHPEVAVTVKVNVARSPEEADLQAQGIDVLQTDVRARSCARGRGGSRADRWRVAEAPEEVEPSGGDAAGGPSRRPNPQRKRPAEGEGEQA